MFVSLGVINAESYVTIHVHFVSHHVVNFSLHVNIPSNNRTTFWLTYKELLWCICDWITSGKILPCLAEVLPNFQLNILVFDGDWSFRSLFNIKAFISLKEIWNSDRKPQKIDRNTLAHSYKTTPQFALNNHMKN